MLLRYTVAVMLGYTIAIYTGNGRDCSGHAAASVSTHMRRENHMDKPGDSEVWSDSVAQPLQSHASASLGEGDLDFIEIGTSSFETLIEKVLGHQ